VLPAAGLDIASPRADRGRFARSLLGLEVGLSVGAAGGAWQLDCRTAHCDAGRLPAAHAVLVLDRSRRVAGVACCAAGWGGRVRHHDAAHIRARRHPVLGPVSLLQPAMFAWGLVILLLGATNYRRWHTGWGATAVERSAELAGTK
jgi:hypothetical protein